MFLVGHLAFPPYFLQFMCEVDETSFCFFRSSNSQLGSPSPKGKYSMLLPKVNPRHTKSRYAVPTCSDMYLITSNKFCSDPSFFYLKLEQYIYINTKPKLLYSESLKTVYCKLTQMTIQMVQMQNGCYYCGRHVLSRETLSSQIILVYTDKSVMLKMRTKKQNQPQSQLGVSQRNQRR